MQKGEEKTAVKIYVILFSILLVIIAVIFGFYLNFDQKERAYESNATAMDTHIQQTIYGDMGQEISYHVVENIGQMDRLLSWKNNFSDIAKINQNAGTSWVDLSQTTLDILTLITEISDISLGTFDATVLPTMRLWNDAIKNNTVPIDEDIQKQLSYVGSSNLKVNLDVHRAKLEKQGCGISLDAIQKGIACDVAIDTYKRYGISGGIITIGNNVGVYGKKPNKTEWRVAIRDPYKDIQEGASVAIFKLTNGCVSTVGNYQGVSQWNNFKVSPILNPKTGYPAKNNLISVTVHHKSGKVADALANACCVLGLENSSYLLKYYNADAIFISDDKKIFTTNKIKNKIVILDKSYSLSGII